MSIESQVELHANYVHISCRGTFNVDAMLEVYESAFRIAASKDRKAVLVDIRGLQGEPPTIMERYKQGLHVAKKQQESGMSILIAVVGNDPMIDPRKFGETVGRNRGAIGRVFTDIDEAVDWIERETGE